MITNKEDLRKCIEKDSCLLLGENRKERIAYMKRVKDAQYYIYVYLKYLRKEEYFRNTCNNNKFKILLALHYERRRNKLGKSLGFYMEANCFGEGLNIFHYGSIVINPGARIGRNCRLHGNNCIGNNGITDECPIIGDNVDIGYGAVIIGDIKIADNITIGANAVVNKSFIEPGIMIAGVPAKKIK